jgi:pimeloyl-ACP methyl ester carboxylesterase
MAGGLQTPASAPGPPVPRRADRRAPRLPAGATPLANGYSHIQGTKPQTLAYALTDSPAGRAAWIAEKFHSWTDQDGELETAIELDWVLTNITLYWVTGAINSSFWPYYAVAHDPWPLPESRIGTPTAYASFPREIRHPPRSFAEQAFNIQRWTEMPRGGHFAALEAPELLAPDLAAFFRPLPQP